MLNFIFRSGTYYVIWYKFQKEIIIVVLSLVVIFVIKSIYDDLFIVFEVGNKDALPGLIFVKWLLIGLVMFYNFYRLKKVKIDKSLRDDLKRMSKTYENWSKKSVYVLNKKGDLKSMTDVILNRYESNDTKDK